MVRKVPKRLVQKIESVPAPIGGLNSRDGIAAMPSTDAVNLVNWQPDTYGVRCRKGFKEWVINIPGDLPVESIMSFFSATTTIPGGTFLTDPTSMPGFLFAATQDGIYDITTTTDAPVLSQALSGSDFAGWFSHTMIVNSAGSPFLLATSEADGYFRFDGAVWTQVTMGAGAGQVSNVDPADFVHVAVWKRRAWFVEKDTTKAWYLPVDSVSGAAAAFDFGPQFKKGGHLSYLANWTIDAGEGIDDFLVAVGSNGDVVVYKGTDPTSADTFGVVGTWYVGQIPAGRRAYTQFGGDLIIVSADGVFPISYVTRGGAEFLQASSKEYTSKIRPTIGEDLRASFTSRGWQAMVHPSERVMMINVPDYGSVSEKQFAMSTTLNSWCIYKDIPIYSLGISVGYAFAGTRDGRVLLILSGFFDDVAYGESTGNGIRGVIQPAFNTFETPVQDKIFGMLRTNFLSIDTPSFMVGINVNYSLAQPISTPSAPSSSSSLWDVSDWDVSVWGGEQRVFTQWNTIGGIGFSGTASLVTTTVADTVLASIDYMYQIGAPF